MRIYLDLLPNERKEELKNKKKFHSAIRQEFLFIVPFVVGVVFLFGINMILNIQLEGFDTINNYEKSQQDSQDLEKYEKKFKEINAQIKTFNDIHGKHVSWSGVLEKFNGLVTENIALNAFSTKDYRIFISGKAKTREGLLTFKEKIESSDCFINVSLPLDVLAIKENVDFQIDFSVKKECLNMMP